MFGSAGDHNFGFETFTEQGAIAFSWAPTVTETEASPAEAPASSSSRTRTVALRAAGEPFSTVTSTLTVAASLATCGVVTLTPNSGIRKFPATFNQTLR